MSDSRKRLVDILAGTPQMSHSDLFQLRKQYPSQAEQNILGPQEHAAFAREWAQKEPLKAGLSLPFAIPAYTAAKALGLKNSRSEPSFEEMALAYKGLWQGLTQ